MATKAVGCFTFLMHVSHWGRARKQTCPFHITDEFVRCFPIVKQHKPASMLCEFVLSNYFLEKALVWYLELRLPKFILYIAASLKLKRLSSTGKSLAVNVLGRMHMFGREEAQVGDEKLGEQGSKSGSSPTTKPCSMVSQCASVPHGSPVPNYLPCTRPSATLMQHILLWFDYFSRAQMRKLLRYCIPPRAQTCVERILHCCTYCYCS